MIYFPLSLLFAMGIREVVVVTGPEDASSLEELLGDGSQWGANLRYAIQAAPRGLADALLAAEGLVDGRPCCVMLGDNVFQGLTLPPLLRAISARSRGATILGIEVEDPRAFGVVECDRQGRVQSLEEKPQQPRSNLAVPGIYFYDEYACERARGLRPSARGELEITDLNRAYHARGQLEVCRIGADIQWLDAGTLEDLRRAGRHVEANEREHRSALGCPELAAFHNGWFDRDWLMHLARGQEASVYGRRLLEDAVREVPA